jgi:hypothetical protein
MKSGLDKLDHLTVMEMRVSVWNGGEAAVSNTHSLPLSKHSLSKKATSGGLSCQDLDTFVAS